MIDATLVLGCLTDSTSVYGQGVEITSLVPVQATCDQLSALASHVTREYGEYGYRFRAVWSITSAVTLAQVSASDGSQFIIGADRWGNVRRLDNSTRDQLASDIAAMHDHATAA